MNKLENNLIIVRDIFSKIEKAFPNLKMNYLEQSELDERQIDFCLNIPKQEGLKFDVQLILQADDELYLSVGTFWCSWFPCIDEKKVAKYIDAVEGVLSGKYRIVETYMGKNAVSSNLESPDEKDWTVIARYSKLHLPLWKKTQKILQNI